MWRGWVRAGRGARRRPRQMARLPAARQLESVSTPRRSLVLILGLWLCVRVTIWRRRRSAAPMSVCMYQALPAPLDQGVRWRLGHDVLASQAWFPF